MTGRTLRLLGVAGLVLGAVAGLVVATRAWWTIGTDGPGVPMSGNTTTGGLATGLALIVAAALPLVLSLRTVGRRVVAVIALLAGIAMVLAGAFPAPPADELVRSELRRHTLANATDLTPTGWPIGYLIAGLVVMAAALAVVFGAGRWPGRANRFDRRRHNVASDDPHEVWKALDAGEDPTAETTAVGDDVAATRPGESGTSGPKRAGHDRMAHDPGSGTEPGEP